MNKNPERPQDIDNLITECFNPTEIPRINAEEEIIKEVFG